MNNVKFIDEFKKRVFKVIETINGAESRGIIEEKEATSLKKGLHISVDLLYETVDLAKEGKND